MPGKRSKYILPNGGEKWWFTVVQNHLKQIQVGCFLSWCRWIFIGFGDVLILFTPAPKTTMCGRRQENDQHDAYIPSLPKSTKHLVSIGIWTPKGLLRRLFVGPNTYSQGIWKTRDIQLCTRWWFQGPNWKILLMEEILHHLGCIKTL